MDPHEEAVARQCLDFLVGAALNSQQAYPISSLPCPKARMREFLKRYIQNFNSHRLDGSIARAEELRAIAGFHTMLSRYVADEDATLVNRVWDSYTASSPITVDTQTIAEWERNFRSTEDYRLYAAITAKIEAEGRVLEAEVRQLAPLAVSLNHLETR